MNKLIAASNQIAYIPIIIGDDIPAVQNAAKELAYYLKCMTGAEFSVCTGDDRQGIRLAVDTTMGEETFRIRCSEDGVSITGGSGRGVLYGVYGFLETVLGVRFYTDDVTKIPRYDVLELPEMDFTDGPAFEYRHTDYGMSTEWRVRNRLNANGPEMLGGGKSYALFVHSFNALVSPELYYDTHPEYFSLVGGKRLRERTQLCLTNPDVIAIAVERAKEYLRRNPGAALISVSQNDCYNPCECPDCARIDAENGSHAGSLIYFVNAVASGIEEEFPDVVVDTLAYQYTRTPPKVIRPRHNVCVRLCSIECCFGHPMETCSHAASFAKNGKTSGAAFQEDLIEWGKICDRVYIWDYVTNYAHYWLPFPNFHVIGPNMKFFAANGVKGVFEESNSQSISPDLMELRVWLLAKLMWNPDFCVEKGIFEFTEEVYGAAASEIRAYIKLLEKRVTEGNIHFGIYEFPFVGYLDPETLSAAQSLLASAQAKTLTQQQRKYVEKAALTVEYAVVAQAALAGVGEPDRMDAMFEKARSMGITRISEWVDWEPAVRLLREWRADKSLAENIMSLAAYMDITPLADIENVIGM